MKHVILATGVELPSWCQSDDALAILNEIAEQRPEPQFYDSTHDMGGRGEEYRGRAAGKLRRLYDAALVRACASDDAAFYAGKEGGAFNALMHPSPDELIKQLLDGVQ